MDLKQVHQGVHRLRTKKRVARGPGSGHGKTGSRGHKGQKSRSGAEKPHLLFEGGQMKAARRIPKRGFTNRWAQEYAVVNVRELNDAFQDGATVDPDALRQSGLARGRYDGVKILGDGELTKRLTAFQRRRAGKTMGKLLTLFKVPELRQKILITMMFLALFRIGAWIPLPIVDQQKMHKWAEGLRQSAAGRIFGYVAMFSGINDIKQTTIFGLGIMPYISASIIFQLLASVVPTLEKLAKEGESGRKKINEYTRYATVVLTLGQSIFWVKYLMNSVRAVPEDMMFTNPTTGVHNWMPGIVAVFIMTAGTIFLMWIGEQIDEYGIGNGISLIIMAGICARMPMAAWQLFSNFSPKFAAGGGKYGLDTVLILAALFVAVVIGVIAITQSQRRIPMQSAKHVRGRRVYGGGSRHFLPLRVNQAGVMPIIFASSLLIFPMAIIGALRQLPHVGDWWWLQEFHSSLQRSGYIYNLFYILLIYFFCYFWTAISFNPKDMATNLKDYGSFIPGYRPGRRTAEYLEKVMLRITYVGAAFLAIVAIFPTVVQTSLTVDPNIANFFGGTGLLIVVSVALDLVQKIDSHLVMRNYAGLLEKG
ncbi:MAG: preprotein translocase subunit SecY [Planctomycetes bacterium]|nr:preprotein translocase subunit SecY [Planctomycetota bacterium]